MLQKHTGSCLCKKVSFEIVGDIKAVTHCHCKMCQKSHGAAFATYAATRKEHFSLLGKGHLARFRSSKDVTRSFCTHCGATVLWEDSGTFSSEWTTFALALLDTPFEREKQKHIHLESKAHWLSINDSRLQHSTDASE
ncbi:GFA family protein [Vibrio penaeicida]|uniref:GFA family protein n=1 Tax=Vibrio penaeicida TaxID=104609 RepID=UPI000CE9E83E|nr:GFA family protein [Vibrio penaeicida]